MLPPVCDIKALLNVPPLIFKVPKITNGILLVKFPLSMVKLPPIFIPNLFPLIV